jgi:hypothetical protein
MMSYTEFTLENYIATVFDIEGAITYIPRLYKSRNILSLAQFERLVSIFDDEKGKTRKQIQEVMSNFSEGSKALGWSHPINLRRLESCIDDDIWNIAGRYMDYIWPDRSIGWNAREYIGEGHG